MSSVFGARQSGTDGKLLANALRALAMDGVEKAKSGHPGMPMGMADVATVLFRKYLKYDATNPEWPDRDRFVLSGGHGSMLLYALLHLTGYEHITLDALKNFRQLGSPTAGHPEVDHKAGIETTTGPLGQGFATAVGMALAERMLAARCGTDLVDHRTWVFCGDGDLEEGISHEAASLAGHLGLSKLIVLYDDNQITIDGATSLSFTEDVLTRFTAYGWVTGRADGHDQESIDRAIAAVLDSGKPAIIACRTVIGYGAPTKAGSSACHGAPLGAKEIEGARANLNWSYPPFEIPADIRAAWAEAGKRGVAIRRRWEEQLGRSPERTKFLAALEKTIPGVDEAIAAIKRDAGANHPKLATRAASGKVLEKIVPLSPVLIGGSADLSPSNNTRVKGIEAVAPGSFAGGYIHYGVREFGMGAVMNGLTLHGGFIPYGGTFLCFADYARPAIRLSALMRQQVIHVMTHDSIGLGEDGPTHQPVEHLASLRCIPNLMVFRPADLVETAECWQLALAEKNRPSLMALSRQDVPTYRNDGAENLSARGAYVLAEAAVGPRQATLVATGTEVEIAMNARQSLEAAGVGCAVVSMPCLSLFATQDEAYRTAVLRPDSSIRVGVEAGLRFGWDSVIGEHGLFIGMTGFGASAPAPVLYEHFGITAEAIVEAVKARLSKH